MNESQSIQELITTTNEWQLDSFFRNLAEADIQT